MFLFKKRKNKKENFCCVCNDSHTITKNSKYLEKITFKKNKKENKILKMNKKQKKEEMEILKDFNDVLKIYNLNFEDLKKENTFDFMDKKELERPPSSTTPEIINIILDMEEANNINLGESTCFVL